MAQRSNHQGLHDKVINELPNVLNTEEYDIYKNPGQEKNAGVNGNYPDIIMTIKDQNTVEFILEVETDDTVTQDEAVNQWKKYADEIDATFYIVVPTYSLSKAKDLCKRNDINARFATFTLTNDKLTFNFE